MNIYALSSLLVSIVPLLLGVFVLSKAPKRGLNQTFLILSISQFIVAFMEFGLRNAESYGEAWLWAKMGAFGWTLPIAAILHFSLVYAGYHKKISLPLLLSVVYLPALVFSFIDYFTELITKDVIAVYWGWTFIFSSNPATISASVWGIGYTVLSILLLIRYSRKLQDDQRQRQTLFVIIGLSCCIVIGIFSELFIPLFNYKIPNLTATGFIVGNLIIGYAILRHGLFVLSPKQVYENIILTMNEALFLIDYYQKIKAFNPAALQLLGYTEQEMLNKPVDILFNNQHHHYLSETDKQRMQEDVQDLMGTNYDVEKVFTNKEGKQIPVAISTSEIHDPKGRVAGIVCTARNIIRRKEAELALNILKEEMEERVKKRTHQLYQMIDDLNSQLQLKNQEADHIQAQLEHLQNILDTIPNPVFYKDKDGRFLGCNRAYESLTGLKNDHIKGKSLFELMPKQIAEIYHQKDKELFSTREKQVFETSIINQDWTLTEVIYHQNLFYDREGSIAGIVGIIIDISDRKKIEAALKHKTDEQSLLLDNIETQIWYLTDNATYGAVNNAHANFMGLDKESMEYKSLYSIFPKENVESYIDSNTEVFVNKTQMRSVEYYMNGNRELRLLSIIKTPKMDENGNIEYVICAAEDITEQKIAEEKLRMHTEYIENELAKKKMSLLKAQSIQQNLITRIIPNVKDFNISAYYMPSEEIGGDYFEIKHLDNKLAVLIADCMGHGIEASLDSVLLKSISDRFLYLLSENKVDVYLQKVNNDIYDYFYGENFITMFACVIDLESKTMFYSNANNEMPFLVNEDSLYQIKRAEGYHIGLYKNQKYELKSLTLKDKDSLFFFSDAVKELKTDRGNMLGTDGIKEIIRHFGNGVESDLRYLMNELRIINGKLPLLDDTTLILIQNISEIKKQEYINKKENLSRVKDDFRDYLSLLDYPKSDINKIIVCLEEMFLNAWIHGNKKNPEKTILIDYTLDTIEARISLLDQGDGFNPEKVPDPTDINRLLKLIEADEEEQYSHGRGISLTKFNMDDVVYNEKGNQVTMIKKRKNKETRFNNIQAEVEPTVIKPLPINDHSVMIVWNKNINENDLLKLDYNGLLIDFDTLPIINSTEIAKLFVIMKNYMKDSKSLVFKIDNEYLKKQIISFGFKNLGTFIC